MALDRRTLSQRVMSNPELVRMVLIVTAIIVLMLVMTAVFGVHQGAPYTIVLDPATGPGMPN